MNFKPPAVNGAPISIVAHPITGGNSDDVVFTANIIEYVNLNQPASPVCCRW